MSASLRLPLGVAALGLLPLTALAAEGAAAPSEVIFLVQIVLLLVCGRLLGEAMTRIGQPAVMGQLIAGILLGPSVLGALAPRLQHFLFPANAEQKAMIDAVGQLGIFMLLLLTGMETDLSVFRSSRRTAFYVSVAGIAVPFACGLGLGWALPDALLPDPARRLITTLFLGTALSISSVKIVAMVVREVGFLRRTVGQIILAAAVIDDTIGWIIMSVTFGLALHGTVDLGALAQALIGTAAFLGVSLTIGRRIVFRLIRWSNDSFRSEMPVITTILVVTGLMALITSAIGVHTVLGAFVAGILIGQSPILTRHIEEQLRGLIVALFMPVFFGLAGLTTDLGMLAHRELLLLTGALILIASLGKFAGAFAGGRLGGMAWSEALAVGCGMNARGSTEVIVATIGLSMGALNRTLYSMIVAMAVVTTLSMPPMLRWALARLPMRADEKARLEREAAEAQGFISKVERLLLAVDASPGGAFASRLAGLLAGLRRLPTTVLHFAGEDAAAGAGAPGPGAVEPPIAEPGAAHPADRSAEAVNRGAEAAQASSAEAAGDPVEITTRIEQPSEAAVGAEARKGYDLLFIGLEPTVEDGVFAPQVMRSVAEFAGAFALVVARGRHRNAATQRPLSILAPVSGTAGSRRGAELAIALAQASGGSLTALHIAEEPASGRLWRRRAGSPDAPSSSAEAVIREVLRRAEIYEVKATGRVRRRGRPEEAILRQLKSGRHDLVVMGVSPRPGEQLYFGRVPAEVIERAGCSVLLVASEAPAALPDEAAGEAAPPGRPARRQPVKRRAASRRKPVTRPVRDRVE